MIVKNFMDCEDVKIEKFPFKGKMLPVKGTSVRWLSKCGDDGSGNPEYGLRYFTIQPGGEIPIHSHFYHQTMYILSGEFECWEFDFQTEEITERYVVAPHNFVYVESQVPHGMKNISDVPGTFLCCIANVYDDESG